MPIARCTVSPRPYGHTRCGLEERNTQFGEPQLFLRHEIDRGLLTRTQPLPFE